MKRPLLYIITGLLFLLWADPVSSQEKLNELLARYNKESIAYISVEELKMMTLNKEVIIADAREPEEFKVSHLQNAELVGYSEFSIEEFSQKFRDKTLPVVVYCSLGIRSENVAEKIRDAGYLNVRNLYGGIFEWKNKGYPVYRKDEQTNKVHAYSKNWSKWLINAEKIY